MAHMEISVPHPTLHSLAEAIATQGYCIVDHFIDDALATELSGEITQIEKNAAMKEAGIGREHVALNKTIRGDSIYWLDENNATAAQKKYFDIMEQLRCSLNKHLYLGLYGLECHFAIYPAGTFYKRHLDCFAGADISKPQRKISCIVYLNQCWDEQDGGQLRLYIDHADTPSKANFIDIPPVAGRAVIFLSDTFYHEVLPANKQRKSLTGWFFTRPQIDI